MFLAGLAICCVGIGALSASSAVDAQSRQAERQLAQKRQKKQVETQCAVTLRDLADTLEGIRAGEFEYPLQLPELPPEDPWGQPIRYRRVSPDRAELRSVGPDGVQGTSDDQLLNLPRE